jgi:eukaryotic-like serine/threonine-protein kinase
VKLELTASTVAFFLILVLVTSNLCFLPEIAQTVNAAAGQNNISDAQSLLQYEWPQPQGDSSSTRFSAGPAPEAPDILWKTTVRGVASYAAAFKGKVFVTTATQVVALDKDTGSILWSTTVQGTDDPFAVYKIDETHLIAGNCCLNIDTGEILWVSTNFTTSAALFASGCYSSQEKMFYTKSNSTVQGWDFSNSSAQPTLAWTTYVPGGGDVGSSIQYGDGKVFPGSNLPHQMALNARNGTVIWDAQTKTAMLFAGSYADGKFFRGGTFDNTFYCFNAQTGAILWRTNPGTQNGYWCSGSAAAYGMVYALNKDGYLYALDMTDGHIVWKYTVNMALYFPGYPVVADGKVYATVDESASLNVTGEHGLSQFACLDAFSGSPVWTMPLEAHAPKETVAIAYGNLYIIPASIKENQMDSYSSSDQVWALGSLPWSMYRHDATHSATGQSGPTNLTLTWMYNTTGAVVSSPSAADGMVYVGSLSGFVYCLNARSGSLLWNFQTGNRIESSPAVVNGAVYVVSDDGYLYCLNALNGSSIWTRYVGADLAANFDSARLVRSSPTVVGDSVCVGSVDSNLYCLNAQTGNVTWTRKTGGVITSSPAVSGGAVYVIAQEPNSGVLYKLVAGNGTVLWRLNLPYQQPSRGTDMLGSPTVAGSIVLVSANRQVFYGVDAVTGNVSWTYSDVDGGFIIGSPLYTEGKLFLTNGYSLVCLEALSGRQLWKVGMGASASILPTYAGGKLYVASDTRVLFVFNATDGAKLSWFEADSNFWSSPTIYEGRVYVGNQDWSVYCLADYPTLTSTLTLALSSSDVYANDAVTGWGQLMPALSNTTVTILLAKPDGATSVMSVKTSSAGNFSFSFTPQSTGSWNVQALWLSDKSFYKSATSTAVALSVQMVPTPTPTETPTPTDTPSPTPSVSPTATPVPLDKQTLWGIPMLYVYGVVIGALIVIIALAALIYRKRGAPDASN